MMNQMDGFKKQMFRVGVMVLAAFSLGAQSSAKVRNDATSEKDMVLRASHARELLGRSYDRSVANVAGRQYLDFGRFIYTTTREMLPEGHKDNAGMIVNSILTESRRNGLDPVFTMSVI